MSETKDKLPADKKHRPKPVESNVEQKSVSRPATDASGAFQRVAADPQSMPSPADILALQRTVGNTAVTEMLDRKDAGASSVEAKVETSLTPSPNSGHMTPSVQRHPVGSELKEKESQVADIEENTAESKKVASQQTPAPPSATRTTEKKQEEETAATTTGSAFTASYALSPGAMSLASAEKILQGSYGDLKKIVPGTVVILADQPACSAKYDEVCMAAGIKRSDGSDWKVGDCAIDDAAAGVTTEGFAWGGVVYVNGKTTLVTATAHEILHNNTGAAFRGKVGETFNEGVTETLARKALKDAGISVPGTTAYPTEVEYTKLLTDFVGFDVVEKAYFGTVQDLVDKFLLKGTGTWENLVSNADKLDKDEVIKSLTAKTT